MDRDTAGSSFFVGRDHELRALAQAVEAAHAGRGRPALLVGEPGIGKTSLVEEFARRITLPDDRMPWGRAPEQEGAPAYWPWLQILRRRLERSDDARVAVEFGPDAEVLAHLLLPALRERVPGLGAPPKRDADQSRFLLFEAVVATLKRAAAHEPLVLVLEDLHWADETSLRLLLFVAEEMRGARFAIVGTCRPAAAWRTSPLYADLARRSDVLEVRGLDRDQVARFVSRATGPAAEARPAPDLVSELHEATGGNPFFLGEVVQHLRREGRIADARLDPSSLRPSDGVRAFIRRHLEPLGTAEMRHLTIAAVLGREFDVATLGAVAGTPAAEALATLSLPVSLRLAEPAESQGRFRFAHALIRETLYGDLSPAERARLHLDVARQLEELHRDSAEPPVAEIAYHYYHAAPLGYADQAALYSARAGERAVRQLAFEDGVGHFERALAALSLREPHDRQRLALQLALGNAALRAGDSVKSRASFEIALRLARAVGDAAAFARAAYGLGGTRVEANSADPALIAALEEALAMADAAPSPQRAALLARLATALYFTQDQERRDRLSLEAVAMARAIGEPTTLAAALITRHFMLWGTPDVEGRLPLADEAIELATRAHHTGLVLEARTWRLVDLFQLGDLAAAEIELERYAHDAGAMRFPKHRRYSALVRATLASLWGSFAEGERLAAEARAIPERRQDTSIEQVYLSNVFLLRHETGNLEEIEPAVAEQARIQSAAPVWRCGLALVELDLGRAARARALLDELAADRFAVLPRDGNLCHSLTYCAETTARLADSERAADVYELLRPYDGRTVTVGSPPCGNRGAVARFLGMTAATCGRREDALRHFEDALVMNERLGALPALAHTQVELAALLADGGAADRERARALVAAARATAERLGMRRLLAELAPSGPERGDAAASRTGGDASPVAPADGAATAVRGEPAEEARTFAATCRREGDFWTVGHGGHTARIKDAKGLALLRTLLAHPGREFHVLELETGSLDAGDAPAAGAPSASAGALAAAGLATSRGGDAGEVLDADARAAYRRRLAELKAELEEARDWADPERAARLQHEMEFLTDELARGVGLGGRSRKAASAVERARLNVTRSLGRVLRRIAEVNPPLGQHLAGTVKTGTYCSYAPDPRLPVRWEL